MEWQDEALILGIRKHGETSAIVELMTRDHGRHLGLVRGGRSRRMRPVLQAGNFVRANWHARLEDQLGTYTIEGRKLHAAQLMSNSVAVFAVQTLASHLRLLPERDPHGGLYKAACVIVENLMDLDITASLLVRFELALLEDLGFGLDLDACAATGQTHSLEFVSPKSGRAVSREAGQPWSDKLLCLPPFLDRHNPEWGRIPEVEHLLMGFKLSTYFFDRHIYMPRGIKASGERASFIRLLSKQGRET